MINKRLYHISEDNPILARVRQFYESEKSDPYIIFLENVSPTDKEVTIFDAQNNIGTAGFGLPAGIGVNYDFKYTSNPIFNINFDEVSGTFVGATIISIFKGAGIFVTYEITGLTLDEAAEKINRAESSPLISNIEPSRAISAYIESDGAANLKLVLQTNDTGYTTYVITGSFSNTLTREDTDFVKYGDARSPYQEFLQQISVKPMAMEGNFIQSSNVVVIQTNDFIDQKLDVNGQISKTFLSLNLDPYMRSGTRTLTNFNLLNAQTSVTLTLPATSTSSIFLYAIEEIEAAEQLNHNVNPENMDDCEIEAPAKPFEDYELPKGGFNF